jgi:hypothetical protein
MDQRFFLGRVRPSAKDSYENYTTQADRWIRYFLKHVTRGDPRQGVHGNPALAQRIGDRYRRDIITYRTGRAKQIDDDHRARQGLYGPADEQELEIRYGRLEDELCRRYDRFVSEVVNLHRRTDRCDCAWEVE